MKSIKIILIVFSLLISLPFVSKAQKVDSTFQKITETPAPQIDSHSKDSTIIEKVVKGGNLRDNYYTMNEIMIPKNDIKKRLLIFNSSELEYKKSKHFGAGSTAVVLTSTIAGFSGLIAYTLIRGIGFGNNIPALFFGSVGVLVIGLPVGQIFGARKREHYKKAISLYNEEIIKRHKY